MEYEIVLKNEKEKLYRIINWILLSANFIFIALFAFSSHFKSPGPVILATLATLSVISIHYFRRKKENQTYIIPFLFFSFAWDSVGLWWAGGANLLFAILSFISQRKLIVSAGKENIIYPSFPQRKIQWTELSNIMLKDGILTIDFKNNKLIQQLIDDSLSAIDEKEFNDFCRQQLLDKKN